MLSLLKKKTDAAAANRMPAWHPNFRNYEQLPDTKAVRTSFFINGGAITVALVLLVYFAVQELQLHSINAQVADWDAQIARDRPASNQAVTQFKQFQAEEAKIAEVTTFLSVRPVVSNLVLRVGQTLPANIALDAFDLRENTINLRATVRGSPDMASGYASQYVDQLRGDAILGPLLDDVALTNINRVPSTGRLAIEIVLKLKPPAKK
ncbi:MAG TPA: hypothetical protein PLF88_02475 [Opitutaceae bacterium]|nr:hypothetical protein [Opitutaceae bacterium]HRJ46025.1 hypothetical protein [Opitutaceae bacterium]